MSISRAKGLNDPLFTDTAVSRPTVLPVLQQIKQYITGIEFINHNSEEENGYNKRKTVSSSGWQIICSSAFCLSVCLSVYIGHSKH